MKSLPTPLSQIKKFEEQTKFSVNVFCFEKELFPLYISQLDQAAKNVDLLYLQENGNSHFCLITDLNRVLGSTKRCKNKYFFCRRCVTWFHQRRAVIKSYPLLQTIRFSES